ncbi:unnamed protein product [Lymnaea stagnalis]|uniref:Peptide chain release factor domain-containing protein n=1 Tax=Lymnaea stagnalis TaxID=6523 RepID=A0AAV2HI24_LYMST
MDRIIMNSPLYFCKRNSTFLIQNIYSTQLLNGRLKNSFKRCHHLLSHYNTFSLEKDPRLHSKSFFGIFRNVHHFQFVHPCFTKWSLIKILAVSNGSSNIRNKHTPSIFTVDNQLYVSFLKSLIDEHKELHETMQGDGNTQIEQRQLRINFLNSVVDIIKKLQEKQVELQELTHIINVEEDVDMKSMIQKEIVEYKEEIQGIEEELIDVLVGEEPADNKATVLEVTAGVGGQEAMLFCAELFALYHNYANHKGWEITGFSNDENELGGSRKATMEVSGEAVYKHLKHEAGVHRVQRIPKTEKAGRIHTSTVTVSVLPQPDEIDVDIQQNDLKIETFRGSGPGGQSVNTTDSAVRITHIPTGTVSECKQERSQIKNKDIAMKRLKLRIFETILEAEEIKRKSTRKMQIGSKGRSEKIRTYNFQQDRITDHRLKENYSNLSEFMLGGEGLDELISSLNCMDKYQTLESMLDAYEMEVSRTKAGKR